MQQFAVCLGPQKQTKCHYIIKHIKMSKTLGAQKCLHTTTNKHTTYKQTIKNSDLSKLTHF